jgi:hypothetical protein
VGRQITRSLTVLEILTVLDLLQLYPAMVSGGWPCVLEHTVRELQGLSYVAHNQRPEPTPGIASSRAFGGPVIALKDLDEAETEFAI